jgi:hypothetical protein
MIKKNFVLSFVLIHTLVVAFAQSKDSTATKNKAQTEIPTLEQLPKPIIGLGVGMFSFYGELSDKKFANPMVSRVAYDLGISEDLTDYLNMRFYVLFGKLGANERSPERNLNFESSIRLGGINLSYNFANFLKQDRIISPYISTGIETFEFLSKTDLRDANGNTYYYWKDGSIKNIDESSANASQAINLNRDYSYESDLREANLDKVGKYGERSWAIPVGAGALLHVNDHLDFKIGTTLHFTFTDNIDNVSSKGEGIRQGDSKNDRFLMSSFSLQYRLGGRDKKEKVEDTEIMDYLASDPDDEDADGVVDMADYSPFTPKGEPVDARGVPLDGDKDLIVNYMDDEVESRKDAIVNAKGVEYTDTMMVVEYGMYMDSTGAYAMKVDLNDKNKEDKKELYKVQLGAYKKGIPPELINKYLSIKDIQSTKIGDSLTVYTAGKYTNYSDADTRKNSLVQKGITDASVVYQTKNKLMPVNGPVEKNSGRKPSKVNPVLTMADLANESNEVIYRVQVGAYRGNVSKEIFGDLPQLISFMGENGITRYVTGNYSTYNEAAKAKIEILLQGFEGAFVVAYKGGQRMSLQSLGVQMLQKETIDESDSNKEMNGISKNKIFFSIQIGNFKSDVPADLLTKFVSIKDIDVDKLPSGNTRYTVGKYPDYASALFRKNELANNYGISGAFIIAFFNGRQIDMNEAKELLNK